MNIASCVSFQFVLAKHLYPGRKQVLFSQCISYEKSDSPENTTNEKFGLEKPLLSLNERVLPKPLFRADFRDRVAQLVKLF